MQRDIEAQNLWDIENHPNLSYRQHLKDRMTFPKVTMPVEKPRPPLTAAQEQERAAMMANHALRNTIQR